MLGAIIGDIVGSRFETCNHKSKVFDLFAPDCCPTDDSTMTLAVAKALLLCNGHWRRLGKQAVRCMQELGRQYPFGYGQSFREWLRAENPKPYGSWGNGAAMRVSPCAWVAESLDEALALSDAVTAVSHDHPEGMKGARAITAAVYLARHGADKREIQSLIRRDYYPLDFTLDALRPRYHFDASCQGSVPPAIEAFLEASDFEDAIRNAVSIGGDSDTIAAMAGSIAEAYFGIPRALREKAVSLLGFTRTGIVNEFEQKYGNRISD